MSKKDLYSKLISGFLVSFALILGQITLIELFISPKSIFEFSMDLTLGMFLVIVMISFIASLYNSGYYEHLKELIFDNKVNRGYTIFGVVSTAVLLASFANIKLVSLGIISIILIIVCFLITSKIVIKKSN